MRKEENQFIDSTILEGMTSIRSLLHAKESGMNDRPIYKILFDEEKAIKNAKNLSYIRALSSKYQYEVEKSTNEEINSLSIGNTHGGLIAICGKRTLPSLSIDSPIKKQGFYAYIDGIEDPYNFGYCIRSLYACGCDGLILNERNWFSASGVVARSSAGVSEIIPAYSSIQEDILSIFKEKQYQIVCADIDTDNELGSTPLSYPILLVVGGEKRGISKDILKHADIKVKIPYASDFKADLSAASATTMFAFEIMRQNKK